MELRNYRKFRHATVEFPDGVTGVIGPNGVGKSSLIEAISWALYGNEPQIVRTSKEEIRFCGASPSDECCVTLEFELGGDHYRLERSMRGRDLKMRASLEINGRLEADGDMAVTQSIIERLGMDYKSFFLSVFARQKDLNALSSLRVHERKRLVLRMLDIDSLDKAIRLISSDASDAKNTTETLSRTLRTEDGRSKRELLERDLDEITRKLEMLRGDISGLREEKETIDLKVTEARQIRDGMSELDRRFNELQSRGLRLASQLEGLKESRETVFKEASQLRGMHEAVANLEGFALEHETLESRREEMEGKLAVLQERRDLLARLRRVGEDRDAILSKKEEVRRSIRDLGDPDEGIQRVDASLEEVGMELDALHGEIGQLESDIGGEKKRRKEQEERLGEISKLGPESSCPTCERKLDQQYDLLLRKLSMEVGERGSRIEELTSVLERTRGTLSTAKKKEAVLKERREKHRKALLSLTRMRESLRGLEDRQSALDKERKEIGSALEKMEEVDFDQGEHEALKARIAVLRPDVEKRREMLVQMRRLPELEIRLSETENGLKEAEKKLEETRTELAGIPYREGDLGRAQSAYEELMESAQIKAEKIWKLETESRVLESEAEGRRSMLAEQGRLEEMAAASTKKQEALNNLKGIMDDFRQHMISRIVPMLSEISSALFSEMTDSRYGGIELNDDYEIFIYDAGQKYPVERFSGGEGDLANLCLRLAISRVIADRSGSSVDFLILDEIFGSQDQERKRNILTTLNRLSRRFRQIILITHIDDVKEFLENVLYVHEMGDGSSLVETGQ